MKLKKENIVFKSEDDKQDTDNAAPKQSLSLEIPLIADSVSLPPLTNTEQAALAPSVSPISPIFPSGHLESNNLQIEKTPKILENSSRFPENPNLENQLELFSAQSKDDTPSPSPIQACKENKTVLTSSSCIVDKSKGAIPKQRRDNQFIPTSCSGVAVTSTFSIVSTTAQQFFYPQITWSPSTTKTTSVHFSRPAVTSFREYDRNQYTSDSSSMSSPHWDTSTHFYNSPLQQHATQFFSPVSTSASLSVAPAAPQAVNSPPPIQTNIHKLSPNSPKSPDSRSSSLSCEPSDDSSDSDSDVFQSPIQEIKTDQKIITQQPKKIIEKEPYKSETPKMAFATSRNQSPMDDLSDPVDNLIDSLRSLGLSKAEAQRKAQAIMRESSE